MQRVRKFLSESDNLKEINRQRKSCDTSGLIDATLIEEIMAQIPQISNRNILRTLTILRKKLPKEAFQSNLKAVLQRRSNLLDDRFETEFATVLDDEGKEVLMPVTSAKHLPTLISMICEKMGYDEKNIKVITLSASYFKNFETFLIAVPLSK